MKRYCKSADVEVHRRLAMNKSATEETLSLLFDINFHRQEIVVALCDNSNTPAAVLEKAYRRDKVGPNHHRGFDVVTAIAGNPNAPVALLQALVQEYAWTFENYNPVEVQAFGTTFLYDPESPYDEQRYIVTIAKSNLQNR